MAKTLYDKLWDDHVVRQEADGTSLLYIDRHLVHEVTSPQAFEGLRMAGRKPWRSGSVLATPDHNVPTTDRRQGISDEVSRIQGLYLDGLGYGPGVSSDQPSPAVEHVDNSDRILHVGVSGTPVVRHGDDRPLAADGVRVRSNDRVVNPVGSRRIRAVKSRTTPSRSIRSCHERRSSSST